MFKDALLLTVFPAAMAFAAATDLFTMTVPNRIALGLAASFFLLAAMIGLGWSEIGVHVLIGLTALLLAFGCFAKGWIGGGDAKLFAATTLWVGPHVLAYSFAAAILGGALSLGLLLWRNLPLPAAATGQDWLVRLHDADEGIPYGMALAAAGLLVYPATPFMAAMGN